MTTNQVPLLVDTNAAAVAVKRPASTVRRWAHEDRFKAHGRDRKGRKLYALQDVIRTATILRAEDPTQPPLLTRRAAQ